MSMDHPTWGELELITRHRGRPGDVDVDWFLTSPSPDPLQESIR
jgi:hypothetical protein